MAFRDAFEQVSVSKSESASVSRNASQSALVSDVYELSVILSASVSCCETEIARNATTSENASESALDRVTEIEMQTSCLALVHPLACLPALCSPVQFACLPWASESEIGTTLRATNYCGPISCTSFVCKLCFPDVFL